MNKGDGRSEVGDTCQKDWWRQYRWQSVQIVESAPLWAAEGQCRRNVGARGKPKKQRTQRTQKQRDEANREAGTPGKKKNRRCAGHRITARASSQGAATDVRSCLPSIRLLTARRQGANCDHDAKFYADNFGRSALGYDA